MSSEKSPEAVGCDASIMKNVWEIREREYGQKMRLEQERIEKSALPSINKDWENRLVARLGNYKRVERKVKPPEDQTNNVWKSKQHQVPPTLPCGSGSGPLGRPGGQRRGFPTPATNNKDKKGQDKNLNRLHLIMFITQNQPSAMVWGKSWKYNKSLPLPAEGATATPDWDKCWIFATPQLNSDEGKPCPNWPNMMDLYSHNLWKKPERVVESQQLDLSLPTEEWQMSWRKSEKNRKKKDTSSGNEKNGPKSGFFTFLLETQHDNEAFCSSEWSKSWRSTKPSQQDNFTVKNDGLMNGSVTNKQDDNDEINFKWEECWRLVNHHGCNKSKLPQVKKSYGPEWADSWRAAMAVFNNHKNSDPSLRQDQKDKYDYHGQKEEHLYIGKTYRDLYLQLHNEFKALSEWSKSWQVTKNNSKPCEEIKKVLKVSLLEMEAQKAEKNPKGHYLTSEKADSCYEKLKHNVIYCPKQEFSQPKLINLKHLDNILSTSEWRDSWKTLKHRMRIERRIRHDPSRTLKASEKGGDMKPTTSEWKDSWIFTCQPLRQEPELWEQGWSTTPQIQVHHARDQNHFPPVELPKNGPTREQSWEESWRLSRPQNRSNPVQCRTQTSQARSSVTSQHPYDSWTHRRYAVSISDWQESWMVSEAQFHLDKPSLTKWSEAWKCSIFHTGLWTEQKPRENGGDVLIQPQREKISLQRSKAKMSQSFDSQMFRERYPEKQWSASWRAGSLLKHQPSHYRSLGIPWNSMTGTTQQLDATFNEHGSKWGRSFRLANPMPHVDQPWVECSPNPCHDIVMWSRGNKQNNIKNNFSNNPATIRLWEKSHQFLQRASAQMKDKTMTKESVEPRMNITKKNKTSRHLYSNTEKEKQSERKWAGCHLLGKTQPRPKKGPASAKKLKMEENKDVFFEEWAESWRSFVHPSGLKKQMPIKSLSGWDKSWKFLLPPYKPMNGLMTK